MTAAEEVAVQAPSEADACVEEDVLAASGGLEGSGELEGSSLPADSDALAAGERDDADESEIGGSDGALDAVRADGAADDGELAGRDAGKVSASSRFDVEALSDIANRVSQAASLVDAAQIARVCKMADAAALPVQLSRARSRLPPAALSMRLLLPQRPPGPLMPLKLQMLRRLVRCLASLRMASVSTRLQAKKRGFPMSRAMRVEAA